MNEANYKWIVSGDEIEKVVVYRENLKITIPVKGVSYSEKEKVIEHLEALWGMGVKLEVLTTGQPEEKRAKEGTPFDEFWNNISENSKTLLHLLDSNWKNKKDIDKELGYTGNPQGIAGVLWSITHKARQYNIIEKDGKSIGTIIKKRWNNIKRDNEYKLTDLGMQIKRNAP